MTARNPYAPPAVDGPADEEDGGAQFEAAATHARYRLLTDEKLMEIVVGKDGYLPVAVALARRELESRGVSPDEQSRIAGAVEALDERSADADRPLPVLAKILCALVPGIIAIIVALIYLALGRKRASIQAFVWMFIGLAFWILVAVVGPR